MQKRIPPGRELGPVRVPLSLFHQASSGTLHSWRARDGPGHRHTRSRAGRVDPHVPCRTGILYFSAICIQMISSAALSAGAHSTLPKAREILRGNLTWQSAMYRFCDADRWQILWRSSTTRRSASWSRMRASGSAQLYNQWKGPCVRWAPTSKRLTC